MYNASKAMIKFDSSDIADIKWIVETIAANNKALIEKWEDEDRVHRQAFIEQMEAEEKRYHAVRIRLVGESWKDDLHKIELAYQKRVVLREKFLWLPERSTYVTDRVQMWEDRYEIKRKLCEIDPVFWGVMFLGPIEMYRDQIRECGFGELVRLTVNSCEFNAERRFYPSYYRSHFGVEGLFGVDHLHQYLELDDREGYMPVDEMNLIQAARKIAKEIEDGTYPHLV